MKLERKFKILGSLLFLLTIQLQSIESVELSNAEISSSKLKDGLSYVPKVAHDQLKVVLESSFGKTVHPVKDEEKLKSIWRQFDAETEKIGRIVNEQAKIVVSKLNNTSFSRILEIPNKLMKELIRLKDYYAASFIPCIVEKKCNEKTRQTYFKNWLEVPSTKSRDDFRDLISNYVVKKYNRFRIFDVILKASKEQGENNPHWNSTASVQNIIYNHHKFIRNIVIQIYRIILYLDEERYMKAKQENWENATSIWKRMNNSRTEFEGDLLKISRAAQNALAEASREIRPSDPDVHVKGDTYIRLTRFVSAVLVKSERVKKIPGFENRYHDKMGEIIESMSDHHQSPYEPWRNQPLMNCTAFLKLVDSIFINERDPERIYHHWSGKDWNSEWHLYGKKINSDDRDLAHYKFKDERFFLSRWFSSPKNKFDLCWVDYSKTDDLSIRKFSSLPVTTSPGNVVTGIRWFLKNGIVYPQIQQGKLIDGGIENGNVSWKETIEDPWSYIVLDVNLRSFNLDEIILPEGSFVTGFQFRITRDEKALTFNIFQGKVDDEGSISSEYQKITLPETIGRSEIMLNHPDVSEDAPHDTQHRIEGEPGKHYVRFQPADLIKDGGQTTVPYLDIQDVVTNPPAPISGIGTYYKAKNGFGGFVGLKLISADVITVLEGEEIKSIFKEIDTGRS